MTRLPIVPTVIATAIVVSCAEDNGNQAPETVAGIETQSGFADVQGGRLVQAS